MSRRPMSVGYTPPEEITQEQREKEEALWVEHLPLLLRASDKIIEMPEMFFCQPARAFLSLAFVGGGRLPLGVLLLLWKDRHFVQPCDTCGGGVHVIGCGGSPLSGTNSYWGICPECKSVKRGSVKEGLSDFWHPVYDAIKRYPNERLIERGETPSFSWGKGLVGESTPDRIARDQVYGLSLEEVILRLQQGGK